MDTNPIYDSSNQPTTATIGTNTEASLSGLPLGKTLSGEVFVKTGAGGGGSNLPYGADNYQVTSQLTAGPAVIVYKRGSTVLKTRTITYTNSGASASDTLVTSVDS